MGCLMFLMSAGFLAALVFYTGAMLGYLAVFFTAMAGYLSVCASVITAFVMWLML
jgi:hypothetical protein